MKCWNEPWMEAIGPDLLLRFWRSKQTTLPLRYRSMFGCVYSVHRSAFGEVWLVEPFL